MPSLVAFNRQWNIGSDDFVFPEITEAIVRTSWVTFGVSVFLFHFPMSCSTHNLTLQFLGLLVINVITILLAILTALVSARGTIMDSQPRRLVPKLIYIRLPIFLVEIALTILSTIHAFRATNGGDSCNFATIARVTIILEWFLIFTASIGLIIVFHLTENDVEDSATIAQRSWSRRMRIFKIGQDHSMRAALDEVAILISSFFVDSDLVPSDVLAGLLLAYHSPNNQYPPIQEKEASSRPSWMNLKDAEYFLHHATCVYGWPTYILYNFRIGAIYRLFRKLQCCGRMRCAQHSDNVTRARQQKKRDIELEEKSLPDTLVRCRKGQSMVVEDNCCYCNTAAVILTNEERNMDLQFMSFRNRVYETPFAVIADHDRRSIVITIRGSCSLIDLVTDLSLEDELLTVDVDQDATLREDEEIDKRGDVRVHRGMLRSARYVFDCLNKNKVLNDLFISNPDYQLVVCGHSLGAGVGSLLTMLLKQEYPSVICYAFAPPGCVISEFGQDEMEKHVMSVVSGDDIVSRMSFQSLHRLRERIFNELTICQRAKHEILIRGVYQLFFKYPWQDEGLSGVRRDATDLESALLTRGNSYGGVQQTLEPSDATTRCLSIRSQSQSLANRLQLYVPGRIVYLSSHEGTTSKTWIDPKCLSEIKLSVSVLSDHMPAAVQKFLSSASSLFEEIIVTSQPMLNPGDLVFFGRNTASEFCEAVEKVVANNDFFHVAIVSNLGTIIEASTDGVREYPNLWKSIAENEPSYVEVVTPLTSEERKDQAAAWSRTKIGLPYNDLFSSDLLNSEGSESYYCSQLITEAFKTDDMKWPSHSLNFNNVKGELIDFWREYFEKRGRKVPQGDEGSHPAQLRRSPVLLPKMRILPHLMNLNALKKGQFLEASHFVGGSLVEMPSDRKFDVIEPRSGKSIATWYYATKEQVDLTVTAAKKGQEGWAQKTWIERSEVLRKTAELLKNHCNDIAHWECVSNGKPISEAKADVLSCVDTFLFYSGISHDLLGRHVPLDQSRFAYTRRIPVGVVAAIGAWNYPIQTCSWKTAPALACGNSVIYKPSPLSPVTALILAEVLKTAGLPDGVFNVIQGDAQTAQDLILHDDVTKVSFTGSIPTGKKIMKACAERNIKPVTLELGGKSSIIVFEDADVDTAVSCAMMANFYSQGQVCSNASKVLVHRKILEEFTTKLVDSTKKMKVGDPLNDDTKVGAHISAEHRNKVEGYISSAIAEGATKLCGGERVVVDGLEGGFYLSPCILSDITRIMTVYQEEIFGSVLLIIPFETEEEAVKIANDTKMGLAAGLVTKDLARSYRVSERLNAGNVYVNTYNDVSPLVPFGGLGESGFGRENGVAALEHYTHLKSVFINTGNCPNPF
ncbi:unnamed protein product [Caenorhabditis sp. 36 PRJEB53466]|nr:unnamed protein product [Caenorhabditis sp. 36 PRJEB53466]